MHFTDYIRFSNSLKDPSWKLTNRQLRAGKIKITKEEFARLLEEAVRERIEQSFPIPEIPPEVSSFCSPYVAEIKEQFEVQKKRNSGLRTLELLSPNSSLPVLPMRLQTYREG